MLGYDAAEKFLSTTNAEERDRISLLARAAREIETGNDLERATQIANAVGKMLGG